MKIKLKVMAIGDSITYGFPYEPDCSWVKIASNKLKIPMVNEGINGETTSEMADRFPEALLREKPTHVIITGGTNDVFDQVPLAAMQRNIIEMGEIALSYGVEVIIGLPIPINDFVMEDILSGFRNWLASYAQAQGWRVIDFYSALLDQKTGFMAEAYDIDGVHPNLKGYKRLAEVVDRELFR